MTGKPVLPPALERVRRRAGHAVTSSGLQDQSSSVKKVHGAKRGIEEVEDAEDPRNSKKPDIAGADHSTTMQDRISSIGDHQATAVSTSKPLGRQYGKPSASSSIAPTLGLGVAPNALATAASYGNQTMLPPPRPSGNFPSLRSIGYTKTGLNRIVRRASRVQQLWPGRIIYCPHHVTARDPGADPTQDTNFVQSRHAIICSKFRLAIVVYVYENGSAFLLPVFSRDGKGLKGLDQDVTQFCMALKDNKDELRKNPTRHEFLTVAEMDCKDDKTGKRKRVGRDSYVYLHEGFSIGWNEDVKFAGKLFGSSTKRMVETYEASQQAAKDTSFKRVPEGMENSVQGIH